ncbi:hypothetical protein GPALN_004942 [Globodera pallida]|nr:hypothetical protein GPALN_004942 [Globodera pallida]
MLSRHIVLISSHRLAGAVPCPPLPLGGRAKAATITTTAVAAAAGDGHGTEQQKHFLASLSDLKSGEADAVVDFDAMNKKVLLLYFSAGWCHTCKDFTPKFKQFYNQTKNDVAVLWISRDKSKEEQLQYYAKSLDPSWLYLPLGKTVRDFLKMYKLYGLPSVKLVDKEGNLVEEELKKDIEAGNADELLQKCKKQLGI